MHRKENWDYLFHAFLLERARTPFAYGVNDCALLAADGILAMTGVDIAADFRGYKTERGALRSIKRVTGGSTVEDAAVYCAAKYGLTELEHPLKAQRGDLVLLTDPNSGSRRMALVHPNGRDVVGPSETGFIHSPITSIHRAWRV